MSYKIFKVETGETEWWMAVDLEQAYMGVSSLYGLSPLEMDEIFFKELSDQEIERLTFRDLEEEDEPEIPARQMADEYIKGSKIKGKDALPYLLASTCF